jgi:hypothetical protein
MFPVAHTDELQRQIRVLHIEKDAKQQEAEDLRRRLHLSKKENRRLKAVLIKVGHDMIEEGHSVDSL